MSDQRFKLSKQEINEIIQLEARNGDKLQPEQLIDAARPKDSLLHDLFKWDDHWCAHEYRKQVADRILRSYHLVRMRVVQSDGTTERKTVHIPLMVVASPAPDEPRVHIKTEVALKDDYIRMQVVNDRLAWIKRGIRQVRFLPELDGLYEELLAVIEKYPKIPPSLKKAAP